MRNIETNRQPVRTAIFRVFAGIIGAAGLLLGVVEFLQRVEWGIRSAIGPAGVCFISVAFILYAVRFNFSRFCGRAQESK